MARHNAKVLADHNNPRSRPQLSPGSKVLVQNQANKAWDRSAVVVEEKGNRQYVIRLEGSGRISLRTRMHLRHAPGALGKPSDPEPADISRPPSPSSPPTWQPSGPSSRRARRPPRWLEDYCVE